MSLSTSLLWRGLLAVAVGIVSVAWPNITVGAFVILFAVYAFIAAAMDTVRAFSSSRAGPVFGYLLLAILSVAAGIVALAWPNITALVLVIWVAAWAVVTGVIEVALAFRQVATAGDRAMWAITGLVSRRSRHRPVHPARYRRAVPGHRLRPVQASSTAPPRWSCPSRPGRWTPPPTGWSTPPPDPTPEKPASLPSREAGLCVSTARCGVPVRRRSNGGGR